MNQCFDCPKTTLSWNQRCALCGLILALSFTQGCKGIGKAVSRGASKAAREAGSIGAEAAGAGAEAAMESWAGHKERKKRIKEARAQWKPRPGSQRSAHESDLMAKTNRKLDADDPKVKDVFCGNPEPNLGNLPITFMPVVFDPTEMTTDVKCLEASRKVMPSPEVCHLVFEDGDGQDLYCFGYDTAGTERGCHTNIGLLWFYLRSSELNRGCGSILENIKKGIEEENERMREFEKNRAK